MAEKHISEVLNSAKTIKAESVKGVEYAQVWTGGTTVNVYWIESGSEETWEEVTCWNVSDSKGRPVSVEEIEHHMSMWFDRARQEGW